MLIFLNTAIAVVVACVFLHNMAILENSPISDEEDISQEETPNIDETEKENRNDVTIWFNFCFIINNDDYNLFQNMNSAFSDFSITKYQH